MGAVISSYHIQAITHPETNKKKTSICAKLSPISQVYIHIKWSRLHGTIDLPIHKLHSIVSIVFRYLCNLSWM